MGNEKKIKSEWIRHTYNQHTQLYNTHTYHANTVLHTQTTIEYAHTFTSKMY